MRTNVLWKDVHHDFCRGCPQAFDRVFRHYQKSLAATARRIVRRESDVEDIVQWTFQRAWLAGSTLRDSSRLKGWLNQIARNRALETLRRRREVEMDPAMVEHIDRGTNTVERDLRGKRMRRQLRAAMADLTPRQRDVFMLRMTTGMNYDAVAKEVGCTPGSARVHYTNALKRVRQRLDQGELCG